MIELYKCTDGHELVRTIPGNGYWDMINIADQLFGDNYHVVDHNGDYRVIGAGHFLRIADGGKE